MFIPCKTPVRGFERVTKTLFRFDERCHLFVRQAGARPSDSIREYTSQTRKASSSAKERQRAEREQLTRLLKESPGKRDARNFLKQFDASKSKKGDGSTAPKAKQATSEVGHTERGAARSGVNLGNLYQPSVFTREPLPDQKYEEEDGNEPLHLALIKLRLPQTLDDRTLRGIALTLSQMAQLGLSTAVVLDCAKQTSGDTPLENDAEYERTIRDQAARFCTALEEYNEPGALLVEHALGYTARNNNAPSAVQSRGQVDVKNSFLLYPTLDDGVIPVLLPFAYDDELKKTAIAADDALLALTREFAGITGQAGRDHTEHGSSTTSRTSEAVERPILDRIIVLDPLGGIPSENRSDGAHVFVNLEAEYHDIKQELQQLTTAPSKDAQGDHAVTLGTGNPLSKFVEEEIVSLPGGPPEQLTTSVPMRHLKNLDVVQRALKLLPPTSSGLILTPSEAATKAIPDDARTTPSKNPLLHNLLTDKPMISSSLPTTPKTGFPNFITPNPATFLKKGVPLTMVPDPRLSGPWLPPSASHPSIDLATDPRINFPKLEELINDSFQRKLDAKAYLARIRGRVAGIIVAGDYEGGAICTWETPGSMVQTRSLTAPATPDSPYFVPYLDKFAVLTSSQGSGGVSDIVWAALTRTCFPGGVVWRSRASNPVNKWYQERAKGTWNLPGGEWTMFWTTEDVVGGWDCEERGVNREMSRWDAYVDVCSGIRPSWADGIQRAD
ncbi:mitochondrial amino-acid acetyltransferase [Phaeosphaeria sp. MPI-PUGE-AT-0046c]|nr:mitochondrial amino-acid acetyltransferase [Phaeosphaeria sp. MPI-PUGE-AT-0046c]